MTDINELLVLGVRCYFLLSHADADDVLSVLVSEIEYIASVVAYVSSTELGFVHSLGRNPTWQTKSPSRTTRLRNYSSLTYSTKGSGGKLGSAISNCVCSPRQ
ncbi:hypothetical protein NE237_015616 [Protea cynaroides]|uniref:Uncharacterized protein n=1 Tax=Protea cynaroides TaxID=273540 RepID=A0A9Q0KED6_9MAGN|nr:hypothetical protein NE237_015616 [Protea cynaroides]